MTVAPMLGYAIGTVAGGADTTALVAFTISALPFGDIITWLRSAAARAANVKDDSKPAPDRLINLPGVDSIIETRLQDQGISTIMQMCDVDPVQLSMRTGLDFPFIIRLVDEALVWSFVGDRLRALNGFGWCGASDIAAAAGESGNLEIASLEFANAKEALDRAATALDKTGHQALTERKQEAELRLRKAKNSLHRLEKLTAAMEKTDAKLIVAGLNNIANRIAEDRYVQFIRRLMYEIDREIGYSRKDSRPPNHPSSPGFRRCLAASPHRPPQVLHSPRSQRVKRARPPRRSQHKQKQGKPRRGLRRKTGPRGILGLTIRPLEAPVSVMVELVTFRATPGADWDAILAEARATIPRWRATPQLVRKHYLLSEDGTECAGLYIWPSRAAGEAAHDAAWRSVVTQRTGSAPTIRYFDLQMLLDNEAGTVTEWSKSGVKSARPAA